MYKAKIIAEMFSSLFKIFVSIIILIKKSQLNSPIKIILFLMFILMLFIRDNMISFIIITYFTTLENKTVKTNINKEIE